MPTIETHFGERLSAVNLGRLMEVGTPVILEAVMRLVYGRKLGNSGLFFFLERGLLYRGWKEDQLLERCLVRRGGAMFYLPLPF